MMILNDRLDIQIFVKGDKLILTLSHVGYKTSSVMYTSRLVRTVVFFPLFAMEIINE